MPQCNFSNASHYIYDIYVHMCMSESFSVVLLFYIITYFENERPCFIYSKAFRI